MSRKVQRTKIRKTILSKNPISFIGTSSPLGKSHILGVSPGTNGRPLCTSSNPAPCIISENVVPLLPSPTVPGAANTLMLSPLTCLRGPNPDPAEPHDHREFIPRIGGTEPPPLTLLPVLPAGLDGPDRKSRDILSEGAVRVLSGARMKSVRTASWCAIGSLIMLPQDAEEERERPGLGFEG